MDGQEVGVGSSLLSKRFEAVGKMEGRCKRGIVPFFRIRVACCAAAALSDMVAGDRDESGISESLLKSFLFDDEAGLFFVGFGV